MKIIDGYVLAQEGALFAVELEPGFIVDVKAHNEELGGPVYIMLNYDGSTVYDGRCSDYTFPGFIYDEKAVIKLVTETIREFGMNCLDDDMFPMPSVLQGFRDDILSGRANIREVTYELGFQGWMKNFDASVTRALLQVPKEKIHVAIESTADCSDSSFHPTLIRNGNLFTGEFQDYFRIVSVNDMARIGDLFSVLDERVFTSFDDARDAVLNDLNLVLISYEELGQEAIDYICGKSSKKGFSMLNEVLEDAQERFNCSQKSEAGSVIESVKE